MTIHFDDYGWSPFTDEDKERVRCYIGREPSPVLAVACRGPDNAPWVVVNDPLPLDRSGTPVPFPTLFWLVWPDAVKRIDRLESEGWIGRLREELLTSSPESALLIHRLAASHRENARLRLELVGEERTQHLKAQHPGKYRVLSRTGVAGMRHTEGIKCLHAHFADYLGRPTAAPHQINPIGQRTLQLLNADGFST